jgi:hypothetical protein
MKASIARSVIFQGIHSNGANEHPAVITRVWNDYQDTKDGPVLVNLTVFPDMGDPVNYSSVPLYESRQEASGQVNSAFWPDRV